MTRFEDLPPVDGEGWLADQGRNFLQATDQRISRLGLPDFMASANKKIQGLGSDLGQMYQGLEQGLSSLPSQAQQASTNFLTSTTGRISGLGSQLGQSVGQGFSDLGSGLRGSTDDLTELLERQREEEERRREEQRERQRQQEEDARRRRDQLTQGVGDRFSDLGTAASGLRDRAGEVLSQEDARWNPGNPLEGLQEYGRAQQAQRATEDVGFSEAMNRAAQRGGYEDVITPKETQFFREAAESAAAGLNFRGGVTGVRTLGADVLDQLGRLTRRRPGTPPTAPATAVRPQAPPLSSVPDTQTVAQTVDDILASQADVAAGRAGRAGRGAPAAAGEIERALTDTRSKVYGAWFDQGDPLRRVQSLIERDLGRPLSEAEDAYLHFRLLAGRGDAAAQDIKDNLLPALRGLSKEDESLLNGFLQAADNADKAAAVGGRVELDALGRPLGKVAGEADLRSAKASLAGRERVLQGARTTADSAEQTLERAEAAYRTAAQGARGRSTAARAQLPQLRSARDRARAARDAARQSLRDAEGALERSDVRAGRAAERGERAEARVAAGQAAAESTQMEGAAEAGAQAAAARRFSGGVIAQPLEEVKAEFVARYGPERAQRLFDAAEGVWGFTRAMRKRLRDSGGLPEDVYQSWEQQFPHYVHSDILDFLPDVNGVGGRVTPGGPLLSVADLGLHRQSVEGTTRARDLPLNSVIRQAFTVEGLARRNEGANALLRLREQSPELQRLLRPYEEGVPLRGDEAVLSAFVDGVQQRLVGPKAVVEGLSRFQGEARNAILDAAATLSGAPLLRAGATGMNALFIPKNALRDAWTFLIRSGAMANPRKFGRSMGDLGRAYWASFVEGQSEPDLREFLRAGGGQAHELFNQTPQEILRRMTREGHLGGRVRPVTNVKDFMGAAGDALMLPLRGVQEFGEKAERAPRLAAYRQARREGQGVSRAALAGRDITADFSRGGTYSKVVNRIVPFFNIALQSPERLLTQDFAKGNRLKTGIGVTTGIILPSLVAEAWNRTVAPEDYADVPDYLKDTGIVVMSKDAPPDNPDGTPGERAYLWLPMPQQYAFLKTVATQAVASAVGDDRRGWGDVLGAITGSLSPLGEDASTGVLPPVLRTAAELSANYDYFRKRPIVSEQYQNLPPEQQATPSTSALSRAVGGVTGRYDLPVVGQLGPAKVEHAIRSTTGGVGQQVLGATDAIARAFGLPASQERPPGVVDAPVVGGLAGTLVRNQGGQTPRDAYRTLDDAKQNEIREQLAAVHEDPAYQAMTAAERAAVDRRVADRVERRYDNRYKAIAQGRATEVLDLQRELAGR